MVDFLSQSNELLRVVEKVKKERGEDYLCGIRSSNDDKVAISEDDLERNLFFFRTEFVRLWRRWDRV